MPVVRMKHGVFLSGSDPCIFLIIDACKSAYFPFGKDVVVTSGVEGSHSRTSLHYKGRALDIRTRDLDDPERVEIADKLRADLGDDYDVVFEGDHFHIELDPKG